MRQSFGFGQFLLNLFFVYFSDDDSHENGSTMHSLFDPEAMEQDDVEEENSPVRSTVRNKAKKRKRSRSPSPNSSTRGRSPGSGHSGISEMINTGCPPLKWWKLNGSEG